MSCKPCPDKACQEIRQRLLAMSDSAYADFQRKLLPTVEPTRIIGVRMPLLRKYAKELAGTDAAKALLSALPHDYLEELALSIALIESIPDYDTALSAVESLLPYIDNWATCDMPAPKALLQEETCLLSKLAEWLAAKEPYTVRYGLVRLMTWFLDAPRFSPRVLEMAAAVAQEDYYVRMAVAWLFSLALIKQYDAALPYFTESRLPKWTHNKAVQKAVESYRLSNETKAYLKSFRR